jgi:membrane protein implicated in regulation of membrane protease activity
MFGAGGMFAHLGLAVGVAAAVLGLATVFDAWLAAVIVAAALFVLAGLLALVGKKSVARGTPPVPTEAIESTKADVAAVRQAVHR